MNEAYELRRLADLMEAWDRFELGMQPPAPMHGNIEAPKLRVAADRIAALEALAVELARAAKMAKGELFWLDRQGCTSRGEYKGFRKGGSVDQARTALDSALASPLLAEIMEKEPDQ